MTMRPSATGGSSLPSWLLLLGSSSSSASGSTAEGRRKGDKERRKTCSCRAAMPPWTQSFIQSRKVLAKGHSLPRSSGSITLLTPDGAGTQIALVLSPLIDAARFLANKVQAERG